MARQGFDVGGAGDGDRALERVVRHRGRLAVGSFVELAEEDLGVRSRGDGDASATKSPRQGANPRESLGADTEALTKRAREGAPELAGIAEIGTCAGEHAETSGRGERRRAARRTPHPADQRRQRRDGEDEPEVAALMRRAVERAAVAEPQRE